jgi:putative DNA primase/helicase
MQMGEESSGISDEILIMLAEALEAERKATPEQIEISQEAQYDFNLVYSVDQHLAQVIPQMPETERLQIAEEIATTCNGQGAAEASRQYAVESLRKSSVEALKSGMLEQKYGRNDVGNGERFALEHHRKFKFLDDRETWLRWDGKRWKEASESDVFRAAKRVVKKMLVEAIKSEDKDDHSWAQSSLASSKLAAMIKCAQSEKSLIDKAKNFDRNPELITVENGTIDLRTGKLRPHAQEDKITTLTEIKYDPQAKCQGWEEFLFQVFDGDLELIDLIHRAVGYSMTGLTSEQAFFILYGGGKNGKGRFVRQLMAILGDAARTTSFHTFTTGRFSEGERNSPALASLAGARLVSAGEPDEGVHLSESIIKALTGEDEIEVCAKYEKPFRYTPAYKIWLHCNYKPGIRGTDVGIWRRPRLIPFRVSFVTKAEAEAKGITGPRKDPDKHLDDKLDAERPGILAWAVRGCIEWFKKELGEAATVEEEIKKYREESNHIGSFIDECLDTGKEAEGKFATFSAVCSAYSAWCSRNLVDEMKGQTLSKRLVASGLVLFRNGKCRGFKDVSVAISSLFSE